ncbi:tRNA lysidine(34) synthetase TilS [Nitrospira sp. NS4]|uniref:tRNA lysidine(34) synthetase TilS n=1 Tax=Nitrospira sp. NS4 TaxID=3414498 RepID=UPI003C2DEF4A
MAGVEQRAVRTPWVPLLHRVVKTVRSRRLFEPGHHLLVALSGGPDSVALLTLLHRLAPRWRLRLTAVHFNYRLRGTESDEDEAFVVSLCEALGISLHCRTLDVRARARRVSLQAEARELRYGAMMTLAGECGADRIVLGHTADDQAETVLLWMLRGSGLAGLAGMPAVREGLIVRPLYEVRRRDIVAYLTQSGQSYRQDSSNRKPVYVRNRIRHELIPVMNQIAPSAIDALCRLADLCRDDEQYLEAQVAGLASSMLREDGQGGWSVERGVVQALPVALQRRLLREALRRCHTSRRPPAFATIEAVRALLFKQTSSARLSLKSVQAAVTGERLHLAPRFILAGPVEREPAAIGVILPVPSHTEWAGTGQQIRVQLVTIEQVCRPPRSQAWSMVVDADRVGGPLKLRSWQRGDRFFPAGMKGRSKKLQDLFVDLKVPKAKRNRIPLLVSQDGIVGVLGYRQDERFGVGASTRNCLIISIGDSLVKEGVR